MNSPEGVIYLVILFFIGSAWLALLFWFLGKDNAEHVFKHVHIFSITFFCFYVVTSISDKAVRITSLLILPLISPVVSQFVFQVTKSGIEVVKKKLAGNGQNQELSEVKRVEMKKEEVK